MSLYVKNYLQYKQRIDLANNDHIFESTFIEIDKKEFDTNKNIIIGLIYKPPNTSVKQFNEKVEKLLSLIQARLLYFVVYGFFQPKMSWLGSKKNTANSKKKKGIFHVR